ncbi:soil-associated protein, TIGR03435 family [Granulicella pectinivorans]|uniref:Soil-associated protein, TIGR03435 family n=1 Tax=Granulicella pectinivorans TaxID=474950 RepID=A0A1I6MED7_9BACT|nr:TIGR03435 family protein [Granulicella pectinivorans]SFS13978.1 soil-associated protein, TIGR03435 family [Granulicella pectinivorans]
MHPLRTLVACALLSVAASAQSTPPAYELVSTVKPSHSSDTRLRISMAVDSITIRDATVRDLLSNTYGLRATLIFNLPKWAESDRFDIRAKVLSDDANYLQHMTRAQRRAIYLQLLADRFGVQAHTESRTLPVYELVRTGPGPHLIENPPPPPSDKPEPIKPGHNGRGSTSVIGTTLDATGVRIGDLCANLGRILDRTIIDKTGLASFYDIALAWKDPAATEDATQESGPSLFTAVQEQLGLKLNPSKGPVEVLIVDKASQPKED